MHGASTFLAARSCPAKLKRFAVAVESRAEAQAIQSFLWCLWLVALSRSSCSSVDDANGNYATTEYDGFCRKVAEAAFTNDGRPVKWTTFALANDTPPPPPATPPPTATALGFPLEGNERYVLISQSSDGAATAPPSGIAPARPTSMNGR